MKRFTTLLMTMLMAFATAFGTAPFQDGIYRLSSNKGDGTVLSVLADGVVTTAQLDTSDLAQVWVITKAALSSTSDSVQNYFMRNAKTGKYISNALSTENNVIATDQLCKISAKAAADSGFYNFCIKSTFSSTDCLSEGSGGEVSIGGNTAKAAEWALDSVTNFTLNQIKDSINANTGYTLLSDIDPDKYYRIINPGEMKAIEENGTDSTLYGMKISDSPMQCWKIKKTGFNNYTFINACSDRYVLPHSGTSSKAYNTTATAPNIYFRIYINANFKSSTYYSICDPAKSNAIGVNDANAIRQGNASDGFSDLGHIWVFQEVDVDSAAFAQARQEIADNYNMMNNLDKAKSNLSIFFDDAACTKLKERFAKMSDTELVDTLRKAYMSKKIQDMALKIKNNTWGKWEKEFRAGRYGAYSDPVYWANRLHQSAYGRQNNPTGIIANQGDELYVFLGQDKPANCAKLILEGCDSTSVFAQETHALSKGLNIIKVENDSCQFYVNYLSKDGELIADLDSIDVHIEGGKVNGYFSTLRHNNDDWVAMNNDSLFFGPVIDVKGKYVMFHMNGAKFKSAVKKDVTSITGLWDEYVYNELDLIGITHSDKYPDAYEDLYPRILNNLMECTSSNKDDDYMYSTWYYTCYHENTLKDILNYTYMDKGNSNQWGPSHEIGHSNQGPIKIVGSTEVSNNLFSNVNIYLHGKCASTGWNIQGVQPYLADTVSWPESCGKMSLFTQTRLYYSLYLYYHVLGINPTFYQQLYKMLRNDPMPGGTNVNGRDDYLKFARAVATVAGENLNDFFEYWGFYRPCDNVTVKDYATYNVTTTQADIDSTKAYIARCGKPNPQIIFIEDRVRAPLKADGTKKAPSEKKYSYEYCEAEMGQYEDYPLNLEPSGYIYSVNSSGVVTVPSSAQNAVGMIVRDKNGRLVYVADTHTFTLPSYVFAEGGYSIYSVRSDGTLTKMLNADTDSYYTLNVYRGKKSPCYTYYINGDSTRMPTMGYNAVAIIKDSNVPDSIKSIDNYVDSTGIAQRLVLSADTSYYSPSAFTARHLQFTYKLHKGINNLCVPFDFDKTMLPSGAKLCTPDTATVVDGKTYIKINETNDKVTAGAPMFIISEKDDSMTVNADNVNILKGGKTTTIGSISYNSNFAEASQIGKIYKSNADCTAFELCPTSLNNLDPFKVWLKSVDSTIPDVYYITADDPVGIKNVKADVKTGKIYDIEGMPVTRPQKGSVYIIDGKKVIY